MNKKDCEALDKFVDEDSLSPEDTKQFTEMTDGERATFIAERFFEAGARYGRQQNSQFWKPIIEKFETKFPNAGNANTVALTALTEAFDIHCRNSELEKEKSELIAALKFYADKSNPNFIVNLDYHDETDCDFHEDTQLTHFGKLARQVLKEVGEE